MMGTWGPSYLGYAQWATASGAHPRWSRNLGTGEALATGVRMAVAEQTVYHDDAHPSALVLPVVRGG